VKSGANLNISRRPRRSTAEVDGAINDGEQWSRAVLPDGIFSNQKTKFGKILEGLATEDVGIFSAF
jgi:hypothetical protein